MCLMMSSPQATPVTAATALPLLMTMLSLQMMLLLPAAVEAATTTPSSASVGVTTTLPGTRISCYVCDPCRLDGTISPAVANNQSICEQCGKQSVGYLGTITRISRQCFRREDSSYTQCNPNKGSDSTQLCCSNGNYCNGASGNQVTHRILIGCAWLMLYQLLLGFDFDIE